MSPAGLRPVDWVTEAAEQVAATQDLRRRIPVEGRDEVARLARSVNAMLEALDAARAQQRALIEDAGHELRTPLTVLRTNVGLLLRSEHHPDRALDPADCRALLTELEAELAALSALVGEIVELARGEAEPEPVTEARLRPIVDQAVARTRTVRGEVRIEVTGQAGSLPLRPATLERAVANLVRNAVQVCPSGGVVDVVVSDTAVAVADRGPGVPAAERDRIFDRFYRSPSARERPGSGLGLAIVAQAARAARRPRHRHRPPWRWCCVHPRPGPNRHHRPVRFSRASG